MTKVIKEEAKKKVEEIEKISETENVEIEESKEESNDELAKPVKIKEAPINGSFRFNQKNKS